MWKHLFSECTKSSPGVFIWWIYITIILSVKLFAPPWFHPTSTPSVAYKNGSLNSRAHWDFNWRSRWAEPALCEVAKFLANFLLIIFRYLEILKATWLLVIVKSDPVSAKSNLLKLVSLKDRQATTESQNTPQTVISLSDLPKTGLKVKY